MSDILETAASAIDAEMRGRMAQQREAKAAGRKSEARDYETMAIALSQAAALVRRLADVRG